MIIPMTVGWSAEELERIGRAGELVIAVRRDEGTLRRGLPIWVVRVGAHVYVRSWHRRDTGWFGQVLKTGRARISVPGLEADVAVTDIGAGPDDLRESVDAAYRSKYGPGGAESMVAPAAAATTLQLSRE